MRDEAAQVNRAVRSGRIIRIKNNEAVRRVYFGCLECIKTVDVQRQVRRAKALPAFQAAGCGGANASDVAYWRLDQNNPIALPNPYRVEPASPVLTPPYNCTCGVTDKVVFGV